MINSSFGKIFERMFEGSLAGTGAPVIAVMAYVIAKQQPVGVLGKQHTEVFLNPILVGAAIGEPQDVVIKAIEFLCKPDEHSTSPDQDGRRLVQVAPYQYLVVNGMKYLEMSREEDRREQNRLAKQRERARKKGVTVEY